MQMLVEVGRTPRLSFRDLALVLQVMERPRQLSQSTRLDRVPSLLEVHDCAPGKPDWRDSSLLENCLASVRI